MNKKHNTHLIVSSLAIDEWSKYSFIFFFSWGFQFSSIFFQGQILTEQEEFIWSDEYIDMKKYASYYHP